MTRSAGHCGDKVLLGVCRGRSVMHVVTEDDDEEDDGDEPEQVLVRQEQTAAPPRRPLRPWKQSSRRAALQMFGIGPPLCDDVAPIDVSTIPIITSRHSFRCTWTSQASRFATRCPTACPCRPPMPRTR